MGEAIQRMRNVVLATAFLATSPSSLAQVTDVTVQKFRTYTQTSATSVSPATANPFGFFVMVRGNNIASITPPVLSGPIASAALPASVWNNGQLQFQGDAWYLGQGEWISPTQADLDAKFGDGTYTLLVNGESIAQPLTGAAYPNPPLATLSGGTWSGGKYVFDPKQPLTITTNPFAGYGTFGADVIFVAAGQFGYTQQNASSNSSNVAIRSIPAHTFTDGSEYVLTITFAQVPSAVVGPDGSWRTSNYHATTNIPIKAQANPVFQMTVSSSITPTVANATAQVQPRPQDVGTTASVFVFAVAPSNKVVNASAAKAAGIAWKAEGATKDDPVQCVLAQINSSGQLQAVSASNLQAYVTGVLSAQGQAVSILNNVATPNVAGAAFYVGMGTSGSAMINNGINQRAVSVPGDIKCDPKAPKTGWWWNTTEGGRGYSIEVAGSHIFFASYLYELNGRATWYVASGNTSLDGSLFTGSLDAYSRGQTLGGAYRAPGPAVSAGSITLAFSDASRGTMAWPGGTTPIERFNIVPNGATMNSTTSEPESGWWWNPEESGRGYFLEWQGGQLFMAGYMYDDENNPIWYLSSGTTSNPQSYAASWWQFANGQTLGGAYRAATRINDNVAPVTIQFSGSENAIMTLPGGRTTNIRRFRF